MGPPLKFYLPFARSPAAADDNWERVRRRLASRGFPSEPRRIWMLGYAGAAGIEVAEVGAFVAELGEPLIMILKAHRKPAFYLCTPSHGIVEGAPWAVRRAKGTRVLDFDEGHALLH
jgi:hypothetical protein